ncbi:MAG: ATP--guanido phosphotransferase [Phycisphaerae bacterium]|nr:ATP--guanido phosphotransferase [Phycisphaerae bacterium]MBT7352122.1 ATP--guanido phosphotransferase [Phycisphaerae bacterium]
MSEPSTDDLTTSESLDEDVVLSSRARLARNVAKLPFVHRSTTDQRREAMTRVQPALESDAAAEPTSWIDLETATSMQRRLLFEQHLISRQHADAKGPRAVAVSSDQALSVMVNEEDHVRMHAMAPGLQPGLCFERIRTFDAAIEPQVGWAFHERWGYQSACATNTGTGIRFSAMLHLPALRITRELEKVRQAAKDLHLAVRGYYGEGSESSGNFYQVSNQITLGCSEEELLDRFVNTIVPGIIDYERSARQVLLRRNRIAVEDRIDRDLAILSSAKLLKVDEAMRRLSSVRLGRCLDIVKTPSLQVINRLFQEIQAGHLQHAADKKLSPEESQAARAELVRKHIGHH